MFREGQPSFEHEQQVDILKERRNKFLHRLNGFARKIMMVGLLAGTVAPGEIEVEFLAKTQSEGRKERKLSLEEKRKKVEELFGTWHPPKSLENKEPEAVPEKTVAGELITFREGMIEELDSEKFTEIINRTFPKGWVDNEVSSISVGYPDETMPSSYGSKVGGKAVGVHMPNPRGKGDIRFTARGQRESVNYLISHVLSHELGHANDWHSDMELNNEERLDLLLAVGARLDAIPRHGSSYVESIENKNKNLERRIKAEEYWAEICEQYFEDADLLPFEDFRLVDSMVKKTNPNFDWRKSAQERRELIEKYIKRTPRNK